MSKPARDSAGNPVAASEMLQHLESDDEALRFHLALVLRCRETLRRQAARRADGGQDGVEGEEAHRQQQIVHRGDDRAAAPRDEPVAAAG